MTPAVLYSLQIAAPFAATSATAMAPSVEHESSNLINGATSTTEVRPQDTKVIFSDAPATTDKGDIALSVTHMPPSLKTPTRRDQTPQYKGGYESLSSTSSAVANDEDAGENARAAWSSCPRQPQRTSRLLCHLKRTVTHSPYHPTAFTHALATDFQPCVANTKAGGSFWGSVFNLLNAAIGAGVLALPSCIQSTGLILGMLVAISLAILLYYSLHIIGKCNVLAQEPSYHRLVSRVLGPRAGNCLM